MKSSLTPSCPKCEHSKTIVVETYPLPDGVRVRRRKCCGCGFVWYTEQPPEQRLGDTTRLIWCKGDVIGLRPPAELPKKGKV